MHRVCCRECRAWCKSFTRTEALLTVLQAALLIVFFAFLVFVILHLIVCAKQELYVINTSTTTVLPTTTSYVPKVSSGTTCTWNPSQKTAAITHYYETDETTEFYTTIAPVSKTSNAEQISKSTSESNTNSEVTYEADEDILELGDLSDGEDADDVYKSFVIALGKIRANREITFGCILTIVSQHWTLTAASCIESIEEVDSLDSFVMLETYGDRLSGKVYAVSDVQVHPQYEGANRSHDLAALKTDEKLLKGTKNAVTLPTMLDYFLVNIGERFSILGYGGFRSVDTSGLTRRLREVKVYSVPGTQCREQDEAALRRHLVATGAALRPSCEHGGAALCVGPLYARGTPCHYCAGTPLLRDGLLLGVMSDNPHCGVACEPTLYVNVAALRDWIDSVISD